MPDRFPARTAPSTFARFQRAGVRRDWPGGRKAEVALSTMRPLCRVAPTADCCGLLFAAVVLLAYGVCVRPVAAQSPPGAPVPLIFDTDIGNDVDDVLALGVIHALASRGECQLLALTITKDEPLAAEFADAVNTFYGRGEVPIGICHSRITSGAGKFLPLAHQEDDGRARYPHEFAPDEPSPAVEVLRRALAGAADGAVVIVQVGFSTNLAELLESPPDEISPLGGTDLVSKKVRLLSIMAGAFRKIPNSRGKLVEHHEYNVIRDIPAARQVASRWPTNVVWSGYEIGLAVRYPHQSIEQDYRYVTHHPLAEAYRLYSPPPHDRPSWDLTSVLYAVRPERSYFGLSPPGQVKVSDKGLTTFTPRDDGRHRYLLLDETQQPRVIEALVQLASQPPCHKDDGP